MKIAMDDVLLDPEDKWILDVASWHITEEGYVGGRIWRDYILLHHVIIEPPPDDWVTDHKNLIKHDCRKDNLRYASRTGNRLNQHRPKDSCIRLLPSGRYNVRVRLNNVRKQVGTYTTYEEAESARDAYRSTLDVGSHYSPHDGQNSRKMVILKNQRLQHLRDVRAC